MKSKKKTIWALAVLFAVAVSSTLLAYNYLPIFTPGPFRGNSSTIGGIDTPRGCARTDGADSAYTAFLRSIPLKKDKTVYFYKGGKIAKGSTARTYAVVDLPLLSNNEQCADACMHIRSEYLYRTGQYGRICFTAANGIEIKYYGGRLRKAFESYMRTVFAYANTESLVKELPGRDLKDIQPGDIFVYKAREGHRYGHAIMVMDVAENQKNGKKYVMLAEGCTPAVDIHVLRNGKSAWFPIIETAKTLHISIFTFYRDELRRFI